MLKRPTTPLLTALLTAVALVPPAVAQESPRQQQPAATQQTRHAPAPSATTQSGNHAADKQGNPANGSGSSAASNTAGNTPQTQGFLKHQTSNQMLTQNLIGMSVTDPQKHEVAKIDGLILDDQGQVKGAVLRVGGIFGFGGKQVALPWSALKVDHAHRVAVINVSKKQLQKAPAFQPKKAEKAQGTSEQSGFAAPDQSSRPSVETIAKPSGRNRG